MVRARGGQHELVRRHRLEDLVDRRRLAGDEHLPRLALQAREVREHAAQRRGAVRDPGRCCSSAVVEVELAGVAELHHGDGGERLRDRADPVLRLGRRLDARLEVGEPDRARPDDLAVAHDRGGDRRQPLGLAARRIRSSRGASASAQASVTVASPARAFGVSVGDVAR